MAFQLSPIIHHRNATKTETTHDRSDSGVKEITSVQEEKPVSTNVFDLSSNTPVEPSTWIGGKSKIIHNLQIKYTNSLLVGNKTTFSNQDSGFSQWLQSDTGESKKMDKNKTKQESSATAVVPKSQPNGLKNIQGDLNDILDRLQNMVANDCLLEGNCYNVK